jgi:hypothetical protein
MKKLHSIHVVAILVCSLVVAACCKTSPPQTVTAVKTGDNTYSLTFSNGSVQDTGAYIMQSVQDSGMVTMQSVQDSGMRTTESVQDTGTAVWLPASVTFSKKGK